MGTQPIVKIRLKVGDSEVDLTIEQTRDLKRFLNDLLPEPTPLPYPVYPRPTGTVYPWWDHYTTMACDPTSNGSTLCLSAR